jgi:hypothetical protein
MQCSLEKIGRPMASGPKFVARPIADVQHVRNVTSGIGNSDTTGVLNSHSSSLSVSKRLVQVRAA